jgi:predicted pyridoxine 5'-phosphate oxidase superfamily flavin-nucleotide-binding protein
VKDLQARRIPQSYARMEENGGWQAEIIPALADFIGRQTSSPHQWRRALSTPGRPSRLLRVLDATTIAFADFAGNRQFISQGNLLKPEGAPVPDRHAHRRRIKIWARLASSRQ